MMYDRVRYWLSYSSQSCAFYNGSDDMRESIFRPSTFDEKIKTFEDYMWQHLCFILNASEKRSVIFSTTDEEEQWRDLVATCPYIEFIDEQPSRQGRYNVQLWIAKSRKGQE